MASGCRRGSAWSPHRTGCRPAAPPAAAGGTARRRAGKGRTHQRPQLAHRRRETGRRCNRAADSRRDRTTRTPPHRARPGARPGWAGAGPACRWCGSRPARACSSGQPAPRNTPIERGMCMAEVTRSQRSPGLRICAAARKAARSLGSSGHGPPESPGPRAGPARRGTGRPRAASVQPSAPPVHEGPPVNRILASGKRRASSGIAAKRSMVSRKLGWPRAWESPAVDTRRPGRRSRPHARSGAPGGGKRSSSGSNSQSATGTRVQRTIARTDGDQDRGGPPPSQDQTQNSRQCEQEEKIARPEHQERELAGDRNAMPNPPCRVAA